MSDAGSRPLRFLAQVLSRCVAVIGTTLVSILVARQLGADSRGDLAIAQTAVGVGTPLLAFSLLNTNTFCAVKYPNRLGQLLANSWLAVALAGLLVALSGPLWSGPWAGLTQLWLVSNVLTGLMSHLATGRGLISFINGVEIMSSSLYLLALGWLWHHQQLTLYAVLLGRVLTACFSGLITFLRLRSICEDPLRLNLQLFRQHSRYGIAGYVLSMLSQANWSMGMIAVAQRCPKDISGQFGVATQIGNLLQLLTQSFTSILYPQCIALPNQTARRARMRMALTTAGLVMAAAALALGFLASYLIVPIFGDAFHPSVQLLWLVLPGIWFLGMEQLASVLISATEVPVTYVIICGAGALFNGVLCHAMVFRWGATGGAVAFSLASALFCLTSVSYALRYESSKEAQKSNLDSPTP